MTISKTPNKRIKHILYLPTGKYLTFFNGLELTDNILELPGDSDYYLNVIPLIIDRKTDGFLLPMFTGKPFLPDVSGFTVRNGILAGKNSSDMFEVIYE